MTRVLIEGTVTPSALLARGKRTTVERTAFVDKLVRNGYVKIVAEYPDPAPVEYGATLVVPELPADDVDEVAAALDPEPVEPPSRSAIKPVWADFLTSQGIAFSPSSTKEQLIAAWYGAE